MKEKCKKGCVSFKEGMCKKCADEYFDTMSEPKERVDMRGNEKDCICEKPKGKHRKNCDAYRLSVFLIRASAAKTIVIKE